MGVPSAAIVYTGESGNISGSGKGAAYSQDISSTMDILDQGLKDIREDERLKKEEQEKKANAWNAMLEKTADVWNLDFEKVKEKSLAYNDYVKFLQGQGYNPYDLPAKESRELERLRAEVVRETNAAKANKEYWDKNTFNINEDAGKTWNQEYATKWFEQYADPNLSPSERARIRQQGKPYQKNVDLTDIVSSIGDTMEEQKLTEGGYDIIGRNKEDFKRLISIYFNDQSGMEDYDALMNSGKYKDDAELMKKAEEIFDAIYKTDKTKRSVSGGGGTKGGSGTQKETKPPVYSSDKTSEPEYDQSIGKNQINVENRTPIYVTDKDNNKVGNFVPGEFKIKPGGAVDVFGKGTNSDGAQVDIVIDYNTNKNEFLSKGYPNVFDLFRDANDPNATTSTGTGGGSLADQMRAKAGMTTGQKKNIVQAPSQPKAPASTSTQKTAPTGASAPVGAPTQNAAPTSGTSANKKGGWNDDWTLKILEHEQKYGAPGGKEFGPKGRYAFENWTGKNAKKMDEYINPVRSQVPNFDSLPDQTKVRLVDYRFNTGRSAKDLILLAAGLIDIDQINADEKTRPGVGKEIKDAWAKFDENQLKDPNFAKKIDAAKKEVYKTTRSESPDLDADNLSKNWLVRTDMWNDFDF